MRTKIFLLSAVAILLAAAVSLAAEASQAWRLEWDKTIATAEKEGALSIHIFDAGPLTEEAVQAFERAFPKIKVSQVRGRGNDLGPRLIADRRPADKLLNEIFDKANK